MLEDSSGEVRFKTIKFIEDEDIVIIGFGLLETGLLEPLDFSVGILSPTSVLQCPPPPIPAPKKKKNIYIYISLAVIKSPNFWVSKKCTYGQASQKS